MSELAAANSSIQQQNSNSSATSQNGDTYIFVPVSVRMDGQKMQLDFKVDSKTLAAAEQLRMAVVRNAGVVEKNSNSTNNNNNSSLSVNGCPPSTSNGSTGTVSDRTKTALRKIVGPQHVGVQIKNERKSSSFVDSYSAPTTPNSTTNEIKSTSKVKNARILLAEKLRRPKQTTTTNGKQTPSSAKRNSTPSLSSTTMKKFKNEIHSTPSSPLDVNLHKFTYQKQQESNGCYSPNYFQQNYNGNYVSDEHFAKADVKNQVDDEFDDVFTLANGNADYQTQDNVYYQQLTNMPVSSTYADVDPIVSTTRDTVEVACNAVLASCRQHAAYVETFRSSPIVINSASTLVDQQPSTVVDVNIVPEHQPIHHKTSKSKSGAPSAMCGFVNPDENKQCRQRCINGFKFCIRHILNDIDAPYHNCEYVKNQGTKQIKCNNAVPHKQNTKFCGTHLIMMGMRQPKSRKKKKNLTGDDLLNKCLPLPMPPDVVQGQDDYYQADAQVYNSAPLSDCGGNSSSTTAVNHNSFHAASVMSSVVNGVCMQQQDEPAHQIYYSSIDQQVHNEAAQDNYVNYQSYVSSTTSFGQQNLNQSQRSSSTCSSSTTAAANCFDFVSRPDSQLSGVSPYLNGYSNLQSPQSPWKMPTTPNSAMMYGVGAQNGHATTSMQTACASDIARNHPELLSKLSTQLDNGSPRAAAIPSTTSTNLSINSISSSTGQGLRAFATMVTSAMFDDSNSGYGGGASFQIGHRQHYSYSNPSGNPLMLGDDPFLGPPAQQLMMQNGVVGDQNSTSCPSSGSIMVNQNGLGVMPSPVPSELSVESVGSHVSSTFQPAYQLSLTAQRPSPPISGYQTPSPSVGGANFGVHLFGNMPSTSYFGSPTSSGAHLPVGSQTSSSSSSIVIGGVEPAVVAHHENQPLTNKNHFVNVKDTQVVTQTTANRNLVATNEIKQPIGSKKTSVSLTTTTKPTTSTSTGKPKKVIRLKPKKRRMKMTGKYRQIPCVSQMCRVIEDLQFDKTDLFPLGLEPSSSDSETDDESVFFLPFVQTLHSSSFSAEFDDQAALSKSDHLNSNVVSAARRQLYMLKRSLSLSNKELRKKNLETKYVGLASRCYPNSVGRALSDLHSGSRMRGKEKMREKTKKLKNDDVVRTAPRPCLYLTTSADTQAKCANDALPYANTCLSHVLHNVDQQMFRYCTAESGVGCKMPALDVGVGDTPKCPAHQDRPAYRALGKVKLEPDDQVNNGKKKVYKTRYILKKHRRRKTKTQATSSFDTAATEGPNDAQDANLNPEITDEDDESEKEDDSNQEAQAALASVARDFGFGAHDLTDILVRLPDATLIENILGQELTRSAEPTTAAKEEMMDSIDRALTATAGDHNWADVEQFLIEENYKSASSTSPQDLDVDYQVTAAPGSSFSWPPSADQGQQRMMNGVVPSGESTTTTAKSLPLRVLPPIESTTNQRISVVPAHQDSRVTTAVPLSSSLQRW